MSKNHRPFIVIEALDAGGSQTQTDLLAKRLKREGLQPHQYHFPQEDRATGRLIYDKFLLHRNREPFSRREQALLYIQDFFSQADDMRRIVEKGSKKDIIVSDRYCTSTMAYQTIGLSGLPRKKMMEWLTWLCWKGTPALLRPTVVLFLDTPVDISLKRLEGKKKDFFETKQKLTAIRASYLKVAQQQKWVIINSVDTSNQQRTKQDIHQEVWAHTSKLLAGSL